jgi:uncharacterized protein (DUF927 family)
MRITKEQLKQIIKEELEAVTGLEEKNQNFSAWKNDGYREYYNKKAAWKNVFDAAVAASYQENPEAEANNIIRAVQQAGKESVNKDRTGFEGITRAIRELEEAGIDTGGALSLLQQWNA